MNKTIASSILLSLIIASPVKAGSLGAAVNVDAGNKQENETTQENVGVVNQTAVYSVGQASTYRIDSVVCPTPSVVLSGSASGGGDFQSSYAVSGSLVIPLGGRTSTDCRDALEARSIHYQVQNEVAISKECAAILGAGVNLNEEQFPLLSQYCQGVTLK